MAGIPRQNNRRVTLRELADLAELIGLLAPDRDIEMAVEEGGARKPREANKGKDFVEEQIERNAAKALISPGPKSQAEDAIRVVGRALVAGGKSRTNAKHAMNLCRHLFGKGALQQAYEETKEMLFHYNTAIAAQPTRPIPAAVNSNRRFRQVWNAVSQLSCSRADNARSRILGIKAYAKLNSKFVKSTASLPSEEDNETAETLFEVTRELGLDVEGHGGIFTRPLWQGRLRDSDVQRLGGMMSYNDTQLRSVIPQENLL